jgi:mono/diheme cytochrome c family protein
MIILSMKFHNPTPKWVSLERQRGDLCMLRIFRYRWIGSLLIFLIIVGLAGMASGDELAVGQSLYATKCHICHGANGRGDGPAAAALNPRPADFTKASFWQDNAVEKIKQTLKKGKGMMPAFSLKDDEIKALIDYMEHAFKK